MVVVVYTFSVVVVVVVVVDGEGEDAGKREGGEAVGEAVRGERREVGGVEAGGEGEGGADGGKVVSRVAVVVEVGRRKVEVEEEPPELG